MSKENDLSDHEILFPDRISSMDWGDWYVLTWFCFTKVFLNYFNKVTIFIEWYL